VIPFLIKPLASSSPGSHGDDLVDVVREGAAPEQESLPLIVRTEHFCLCRSEHTVRVIHRLTPDRIDSDVIGLIIDELFTPGWLVGIAVFERVLTGVVLSIKDDPLESWLAFYDNTLAHIRERWRVPELDPHSCWTDEFAALYQHALRLVPTGEVLDLGACLGFLSLLMVDTPGRSVTACDLSPAGIGLLSEVSAARHIPLRTLVCDATCVPLPDKAVDTVTVIHLFGCLESEECREVLGEALRLARRRVIVGVPADDRCAVVHGRGRRISRAELAELGSRDGQRLEFESDESLGSWLVVDLPG
jgi:predicted RNA methylase